MAKYLVAIPFALVAFGCTDFSAELEDSSYMRKSLSSNQELRDYPCTKSNDGEEVILTNLDRVSFMYECTDGAWIGVEKGDVVKPGSSSDSKNSSKAEDSKSSSSAKGSSSSATAPKSSASSATAGSSSSKTTSNGDVPTPTPTPVVESRLGSCVLYEGSVADKGTPAKFKFVANNGAVSDPTLLMTAKYKWNYRSFAYDDSEKGRVSAGVIFTESGNQSVSVTVTAGEETEVIPCPVFVRGDPITDCECLADAPEVDVYVAEVAKWNVTGCKSASKITEYEWTDAKGTGTTASYAFTERGESLAPSVTVYNDDNYEIELKCESVKAIDSRYIFNLEEYGVEVKLPVGQSTVYMHMEESDYECGSKDEFYFKCVFADSADYKDISVDGRHYEALGLFRISLHCSRAAEGNALEVELDTPAVCSTIRE